MTAQINSWPDTQGALEGSHCKVVPLSHSETRGGTMVPIAPVLLCRSGTGHHHQSEVGG